LTSIGTKEINIIFFHRIDLTIPVVNISIYQKHNEHKLLRQIFLTTDQYCEISNDYYSLTIKLLDITFNVPNAIYYVEIDDDFLKYKTEFEYNNTIPGIKSDKWIIKTKGGMKSLNINCVVNFFLLKSIILIYSRI
jgi:hypothetical protein